MNNSFFTNKGRTERALPWVLSLLVMLVGFFFLLGGMVIPAIGSYY